MQIKRWGMNNELIQRWRKIGEFLVQNMKWVVFGIFGFNISMP